jgi:hypothetical protein
MSYASGSGSESESNGQRWVPHTCLLCMCANIGGRFIAHADYGIGRIDTDADTDPDADKP